MAVGLEVENPQEATASEDGTLPYQLLQVALGRCVWNRVYMTGFGECT